MNTRPVLEPSNSPVALSAGFNKDASCFAVGLDSGFSSMYKINPIQSLAKFGLQYLIPNHVNYVLHKVRTPVQQVDLNHMLSCDRFQRRCRGS